MLKLLRNNRLLINTKSYNNNYLLNRNLSVLLNNVNLESTISPSSIDNNIDNNIDYKNLLPEICKLGKKNLYKDISNLIINIPIEQLINESVKDILIKTPEKYKQNISKIGGLIENTNKDGRINKFDFISENLRSDFALIHIIDSFSSTKNNKIWNILDYSYTNISISDIIGSRRLVRICKQFNINDVNNNNNKNIIINEKNMQKLLINQYIKWLIDMSTNQVMVSLKYLIKSLLYYNVKNTATIIENLMKEIDNEIKKDTKFVSESILGDMALISFSVLRQTRQTIALPFLKKSKDSGFMSPYYLDSGPYTLSILGCLPNKYFTNTKNDLTMDNKKYLNELFNCVLGSTEREIFLREQFFQVLMSQNQYNLVLEFGEILKTTESLHGSRIYNLIASIQAKELNSSEIWENTIDKMKEEAAFVSLNPRPKREQIGLIDYPHVEFGPNVHTYLSIMRSISNKKIPINEAIKEVNMLLNRMLLDGVMPDMRLLFKIAELGREGLDFPLVMKAVELAHYTGSVPRRNANPMDTSWQPPTTLPRNLHASEIDSNYKKFLSKRVISMTENEKCDQNNPSSGKKLVIYSHDEMAQIYHYAIDTAKLCKRPDDAMFLVNVMLNMNLIPASHSISHAMRCLLDHHRPGDVMRIFEFMPEKGIERDKRHGSLFIEALVQSNRYSDAWRGLLHMNASGSPLLISAYRKLLSQLLTSLSRELKFIDQSKSKVSRQNLLEISVKTFCHVVDKLKTDDKVKTRASVKPSLAVVRKFIDTSSDDLVKRFFNVVDATEGNVEAIEILKNIKPRYIQSGKKERNIINRQYKDEEHK
jgi:hypothetical protein